MMLFGRLLVGSPSSCPRNAIEVGSEVERRRNVRRIAAVRGNAATASQQTPGL
jgi:hypothetical protein